MASSFGFPPPPTKPESALSSLGVTSGATASSTTAPIPCPPGTHPSGPGSTDCIGNLPSGDPSPAPPYPAPGPVIPPQPTPTPTPTAGTCPEGTANGYASCCPDGPAGQRVWRSDTKTCEYEDDRQKRGEDTCRGNPITCPPGQDAWCNFTTAQFQCAAGGSSSGSGSGGSGSGTKSSGSFGTGSQGSIDFNTLLGGNLQDLLNSPSRFTPQALQAIYGEIARQSSDQIARGERGVRADAARRGMSRAGSTGAAIAAVRAGAEQQRGTATVGVQMAKINADHQDKLDAIDRAQKYLDSLRDNEYRYTLLGEQRRQFDSNLALAYANLAQQRAMLQMQLQSAWDMLGSQQAFYLVNGGV